MPTKLTQKQILQIPELKKTLTADQIAVMFNVQPRTIRYWLTQLRKAGHKITKSKGGRKAIDLHVK